MRNFSPLFLVVLMGTSCVSSQTVKSDAKAVGNTLVDCTTADKSQLVAALAPTFLNLFEGQSNNWSATGDSLLGLLGDVGKCAAQKGLDALEAKLAAATKPGMAVDTRPLQAARKYMAAKNFNLKTK